MTISFTDQEKDSILSYKYHGGDSSPTYKYLLSPWAQFCVDSFVPNNIAPNILTVSGLVFTLASFFATLVFNPTLDVGGPRWLHILTGLCIFAYQTLDNMDGKQARKTGSSNALGMFFDHGCDALNAGLAVVGMASVIGTGWTPRIFLTYWSAFPTFYFQTWEEYYLGCMILPPFNGPSDGLLLSVLISIVAYFFGNEIFYYTVFEVPEIFIPIFDTKLLGEIGFPTSDRPYVTPYLIMFSIVLCAGISTAIKHIIAVFIHLSKQGKSLFEAIHSLAPFLMFFPLMYYFCIHGHLGLDSYPILCAVMFASILAEMVIKIMLAHIINRRLQPFNVPSLWVFFVLSYLDLYHSGDPFILRGELALLIFNTIFSTVCTVALFIVECAQFADTLGVFVFSLGRKS